MRYRCCLNLLLAIIVTVISSSQAMASIVYSNGPIDGNTMGWSIAKTAAVTDSFTVTSATTVTSVEIGLWASPNDYPTSLDWSIGTSPFGSQDGSGNGSTLTNSYKFTNSQGYAVLSSTFSLMVPLDAGTYWLTLDKAVVPVANGIVYWDQNNGRSIAKAADETVSYVDSESFQINDGQSGPIPEPSAIVIWSLFGGVAIGLGWWRRRKAAYSE